MTLDQEDIAAIAAEVVRQLDSRVVAQIKEAARQGAVEGVAHYFATPPTLESTLSYRQGIELEVAEGIRQVTERMERKRNEYLKKREQPLAGQVFTSWEAAEVLGISLEKLAKLRSTDKGPKFIKVSRAFNYRGRDLEEYIKTRDEE